MGDLCLQVEFNIFLRCFDSYNPQINSYGCILPCLTLILAAIIRGLTFDIPNIFMQIRWKDARMIGVNVHRFAKIEKNSW